MDIITYLSNFGMSSSPTCVRGWSPLGRERMAGRQPRTPCVPSTSHIQGMFNCGLYIFHINATHFIHTIFFLTTYICLPLTLHHAQITKIYFLGAPQPTEGDVWYLWLLLKRGGCTPRSFLEARTHDGTTYDCFKDTCRARGLLDYYPLNQESSLCLQEAIENNATPRQLRRLFILLVVGAKPVAAAFDTYHTHMIEPAWIGNHPSETARLLKLLQCLQRHLLAEGCKSVQHLGLKVPEGFALEDSELQRTRVAQHLDHRGKDVDTVLRALAMFTDEQRVVFDTIVNACQSGQDFTFDIRGRAGTGKTMLMNAISAKFGLKIISLRLLHQPVWHRWTNLSA